MRPYKVCFYIFTYTSVCIVQVAIRMGNSVWASGTVWCALWSIWTEKHKPHTHSSSRLSVRLFVCTHLSTIHLSVIACVCVYTLICLSSWVQWCMQQGKYVKHNTFISCVKNAALRFPVWSETVAVDVQCVCS